VTTPDNQDAAWLEDVTPDEMRRMVDALYRTHHLISHINDLDTLLGRIMEESKQVAHAEACSLMLYDPESEELFFRVALGESGDQEALKQAIRLKLSEGIAGVAAANRESINVQDAPADQRWSNAADQASHFETRSILAVPLIDKDVLVGVVEVLNKIGGGPFTNTDLHLMEMFASLAATAIANARLIEENLKRERLAAVGQAVAGLSHYTKNIITGMTGSADLIDAGLNQANTELLKRSWPVFKRSTKRISNFVEDMLAFSKPREPNLETCDLAALFEEVRETFLGLLVRKQVQVEIDTGQIAPRVYVDRDGIFRCLLNIFMNAAEAAPSENGRIWASARIVDNGELELDVEDNGPGVPEEDIERIFEPFYSSKGSRGTGLGLAVTRKIVAEHSGHVEVLRGARGGALFRILLPQDQILE